jgi:hypothetical protein
MPWKSKKKIPKDVKESGGKKQNWVKRNGFDSIGAAYGQN